MADPLWIPVGEDVGEPVLAYSGGDMMIGCLERELPEDGGGWFCINAFDKLSDVTHYTSLRHLRNAHAKGMVLNQPRNINTIKIHEGW